MKFNTAAEAPISKLCDELNYKFHTTGRLGVLRQNSLSDIETHFLEF